MLVITLKPAELVAALHALTLFPLHRHWQASGHTGVRDTAGANWQETLVIFIPKFNPNCADNLCFPPEPTSIICMIWNVYHVDEPVMQNEATSRL